MCLYSYFITGCLNKILDVYVGPDCSTQKNIFLKLIIKVEEKKQLQF